MTCHAQIVPFPTWRQRMIAELARADAEAMKLNVIAEGLADKHGDKLARMNASNAAAMLRGIIGGVIHDLERNGR